MLYSVNLGQDVCVGSCLHLLNALFVTEWSRKVGTGGGDSAYYFHPSDIQKAYTAKKFNVLVQLTTFSTFILSDSLVSHFVTW